MMQVIVALIAAIGLVLASMLPVFGEAEGNLAPHYCLLVAVTFAGLLILFSWRGGFGRSGFWFALLIVGQALALQLIDAGPLIHYQHYRVIGGMSGRYDLILLAILLLQSVAVFSAIRKRFPVGVTWVRTNFGMARILAVFGAMVALSVFPSRDPSAFMFELALAAWILLNQLGCLAQGLLSVPTAKWDRWNERIVHILGGSGAKRRGIDRLAVVCAAWVVCASAALSALSYEKHPHIPDEFAYIYQANYFAEGRLDAPVPPVPEAVEAYLMDCDRERCISPFPPGWPGILALGVIFDAHWLVNPILAGINVILLFHLVLLLYDRFTARLGIVLLSVSPWYLFMSMSFMSHIFSLSGALLAALCVAMMHRRRNAFWAIPGGLAIGLVTLTRPLEGVMVALTLGLVSLFIPGRRLRLVPALVLTLTTAAGAGATLLYNNAITGDAFRFPVMAYMDRIFGPGINALGFGPDRGLSWSGIDPFPGHGLPDVVVNNTLSLQAINIEMFGWAVGSLVPILLLLLWRKRGRLEPADRWMLVFIGAVFVLQSLYWYAAAAGFGARYHFLVIAPLVVLTARAVVRFGQRLETAAPGRPTGQGVVLMAISVLSLSTLLNFVPWRAIDKYHHYRNMRPDVRGIIAGEAAGPTLLLISGRKHPDLNSALVYSAIDPKGEEPVVAWDRSPDVRQRVLQAYPERPVFLIDGPSVTGMGYQIRAGPLSAEDLLE
jgi:hypothetical protein